MRETTPSVFLIARPVARPRGHARLPRGRRRRVVARAPPGGVGRRAERRRAAGRVRAAAPATAAGSPASTRTSPSPHRPARSTSRTSCAACTAACSSTPATRSRFRNVSRVFTHELVRHRAGSAFSQESLRYVRLTDIGFRVPPALEPVREQVLSLVEQLEEFQVSAAEKLGHRRGGRALPRQEGGHLGAAPAGADRPQHRHHLDRERAHAAPRDRDAHRRGRRGGAAPRLRRGRADHDAPRRRSLFQDFSRSEDGSWVPEYRKV